MSELKDQTIDQGVRKRTEYDDARRARLVLNIARSDGGTLAIPLLENARSTEEQAGLQQNTLLAVLPLARLPGYDKQNEAPKGALPRSGRIYVFWGTHLWRELQADGAGQLFEVDLAHWREQAAQGASADERPPVGARQHLILLPMLLQGQAVTGELHMAYSELPWTWEYIEWLEEDLARIKRRCRNLAPAWAAAIGEPEHWRATQAMPALAIDTLSEGLRARDFAVESNLADPATFTPGFTGFAEDEWVMRLQHAKEELAEHQGDPRPEPLPDLEAGADALAEYNLRGYPKLIGFILDDPLFSLRHATAQMRLTGAYLLCQNALVTQHPHGAYVQALYSMVMRPGDNPLAHLQAHLDTSGVREAAREAQRNAAQVHLKAILARLITLTDQLAPFIGDWLISNDERLLEPYALLGEILEVLKHPSQSDALYLASGNDDLGKAINRLTIQLLKATHAVTRPLLSDTEQAVIRLQHLAGVGREANPQRMGLSTLLLAASADSAAIDTLALNKNTTALVGDLMDIVSTAVCTQVSRLSDAVVAVEMPRLFAPSLGVFKTLSPSWRGLELMSREQALAQRLVILGVEGRGLSYGLTSEERTILTTKNYSHAVVHDQADNPIASNSPRRMPNQPNLGRTTVIAAPADHPHVRTLSAWKLQANRKIQGVLETPAIPLVAVVCAVFNLQAQIVGMRGLTQEGSEGDLRYRAGFISAGLDMAAALGNLSKPMLGAHSSLVQMLDKPRFNVSKISDKWAKSLEALTGHSRLTLLRAVSGAAMVATSLLSAWDASRAWRQGDRDAALAYGLATSGSALWTAATLGMAINPLVLLIGGLIFIGGSLLANWLTDTDLEALAKHGPFGKQHPEADEEPFGHLRDPWNAYAQLFGMLGKPIIQVAPLSDWRKNAPAQHQAVLRRIAAQRLPMPLGCQPMPMPVQMQPLEDSDWVMTLQSPLLPLFQGGRDFVLLPEEQVQTLPRSDAARIQPLHRKAINEFKLTAYPLDETTSIYVLPRQFPPVQLSLREQYHYRIVQRVVIRAQFHLSQPRKPGDQDGAAKTLVLPQPSPKRWQAWQEAFRRQPTPTIFSNDAPYWLIETTEFKA